MRPKELAQSLAVVLGGRPGIVVHVEHGRGWVHFTDGRQPVQASAAPEDLTRASGPAKERSSK